MKINTNGAVERNTPLTGEAARLNEAARAGQCGVSAKAAADTRLAECTMCTDPPTYSPYGYIIDADGKVYSLTRQYYHGVVCALLYPAIAEERDIVVPADPNKINVYDYQAFEHDEAYRIPAIRISTGGLLGGIYVSKGIAPATEAQMESLRNTFKVMGLKARSKVAEDDGDFDVANCLQRMTSTDDYLQPEPGDESDLDRRRESRKAWGLDE